MPGSTPATSQLDWGNDCAILVQGDEGPAQVIQLGHNGTPSVICQRRWCHLLVACPIPSLGIGSSRQQSSYSAIPSVVFGDKTGDNTPLSKRGSRDGETSKQFAPATEKWGLAGTGFGTGRATGYPR